MEDRLPIVSRRIIAADLFSDVGNQVIALFLVDLLVFKGDNALSSLVVLCLVHQLPSILLSPLAGRGVDRLGPGKWMALVNLGKCLLVGALFLATTRWALFALYLMFVSASLFFSIGLFSAVPLLIPRERILRFNAINERVAIGGALLFPWLIGMFLSRTDKTAPLSLAVLAFAGTISLVASLPDPRRHGTSTGRQKETARDLIRGSRLLLGKNSGLPLCFIMLGLVVLCGGFINLGMPLLFKNALDGNIGHWGFVLSAFQAGAFLATLLLPHCSTIMRRRGVPAAGFLLLGAAMIILPLVDGFIQLAGLMTLFGFGLTLLQLFWESRIQQNIPQTAIGRVMSLMSTFKGICFLCAILFGATISSFWGVQSFLMIGAVFMGSASFAVRRI
ncbi:MAG: MFS transporter [Thermodesulfobacteriota bacterium]